MPMNLNSRNTAALLAGTALIVLFAGLGFRELESGDETRAAGIAAEMLTGRGWLIPRLNGSPFLEYPPLHSWAAALSYSVFGINSFAAKLPSVLAAFGLVMLTFGFARRLKFSVPESFLSGAVLLFSIPFFSESRTCRVDMMLAFFILLSLSEFYAAAEAQRFRGRILHWGLFALGLAGGIGTKGMIGIVLPGIVIGSWLFISDYLHSRIAFGRYAAAFAGGVLALGLAGIWYALLWKYGGKEMFTAAFWTNNFGRFSGSQSDHAESFSYYFIKLPGLFLPWLPLLPFAVCAAFRKRNEALLLPLLAVSVPFLILCLASGKRVVYLLPLSAPCALLCGWYLCSLPEKVQNFCRRFLTKIPVPPARLGIAALAAAAALVIGIDIGTAVHMNRKKSLRPLFEYCRKLENGGFAPVLIDPAERTRGAAFFYLHHRLPEASSKGRTRAPNERWIVRDKQSGNAGKTFADHHIVLGE